MTRHITLTPVPGPVTVLAGGTDLGRSLRAVELCEVGYPPVVYVPRADVDMTRLSRTDWTTVCPWKGWASHFSIRTAEGVLGNAAWSYETPLPEMAAIAGHLAFYADKVTIMRG